MFRHTLVKTIMAVAGIVLAAAVSTASVAAPITTLFNTGTDAANSAAAVSNNATELHYSLISVPAGETTNVRVATAANGFPVAPGGPWLGVNGVSNWIGLNTTTELTGLAGTYIYRLSFSLTGLNAATASITGQWAADNTGSNIRLNGVSTGNTASGFTAFTPFSLTSGFVTGANTLDFVVNNIDGPTGLRVELSGTATPAGVTAAPEPASFLVLTMALAGLQVIRRRRA